MREVWYKVEEAFPVSMTAVKVGLESPEHVTIGGVRHAKETRHRKIVRNKLLAFSLFNAAWENVEQTQRQAMLQALESLKGQKDKTEGE